MAKNIKDIWQPNGSRFRPIPIRTQETMEVSDWYGQQVAVRHNEKRRRIQLEERMVADLLKLPRKTRIALLLFLIDSKILIHIPEELVIKLRSQKI